ncbi:MAG: hypothetical protein A4E60_02598 [Syntrophorhabdus sp. PtaB.Bin047]|jgi:hypothetical protein|nr:MAG: hypothetical protein A4E60_02598 [Syntrophorhabdus sp. PtaB.Bin047]OPY76502.1 MAG: hypothetical protein A4E63_00073 [Syntrophorhabdus sp. PtaU1.Bin050]
MNTCQILTKSVLESDGPLFDFLVIDEPLPAEGYWPDEEFCQKRRFLQFGEFVMENVYKCFWVGDIFDYYGLTNYHREDDLGALINNLESEMESFRALSTVAQFRQRFPYTFDHYLTGEMADDDGPIVNQNWVCIRDDLVKTLACIRDKAAYCIETGKVLAIVGI